MRSGVDRGITVRADRWPDHVRLPDIEDGLVCTACGKRGAEVRLKFSQARTGTGYMPRSCGDGQAPSPSVTRRLQGRGLAAQGVSGKCTATEPTQDD